MSATWAALIRLCFQHAGATIAAWSVAAIAGLALAIVATDFDFKTADIAAEPTAAATALADFADQFPNLDNLVALRVLGRTPAQVATARDAMIAALSARSDVFYVALSPGNGTYYQSFAAVLQDTESLASQLQYVQDLRPLLEALAQDRSLNGLSVLAGSVAETANEGRNPQVFVDLFNQLAGTLQAAAKNGRKPVDWLAIAGLQKPADPKQALVLAWPKQGMDTEARNVVAGILATAYDGSRVTLLNNPAVETGEALRVNVANWIAAAAMALIFAALVLIILSASASFMVMVMALWLAVAASAGAILPFFAPVETTHVLIYGSALLFALLFVAHAANAYILAGLDRDIRLQEMAEGSGADAMRRMLCVLVYLGAGLGLLVYVPFQLSKALVFCAGVFAIAGLATITLLPALGGMLSSDAFTMQVVRANSHGARKSIIAVVIVLSAIALAVLVPAVLRRPVEPVSTQPSVSLLVKDAATAMSAVDRLNQIKEVKGTRWLGGFLPQDSSAKQELLAAVQNTLPASLADNAAPTLEVARKVEQALTAIAQSQGANQAMRAAALNARRSLTVLLESTGTAKLADVERDAFDGLNVLETGLKTLSAIKMPTEADLDPALRALFRSPSGVYRIEIEPADGMSANGLAFALARQGFVPASHALAQWAGQQQLARILFAVLGIGLIASMLTLVLVRPDHASLLRSLLAVLVTCLLVLVVALARGAAVQSHHVVWIVAVFAGLWGQAAFTPAAESFVSRRKPRALGVDGLQWLPPLTVMGIALALVLVGQTDEAMLTLTASAILLLSASLSAIASSRSR